MAQDPARDPDVPMVRVARHDTAAGPAAVVTMDRPRARNAMSTALLVQLLDVLDDVESVEGVVGVVVRGAGGTFSAGADVREEVADGGRRRMELFTLVYERLALAALPTVAVLTGPAVGGGAEVAAACDLRVVEPAAMVRFPGSRFGWPVGTARTLGLVGLGTARDWVLSSRDVGHDELVASGFAQRAVDAGEGLDAALAWLGQVGAGDRDTVALLKRMFLDSSGLRDRVMFENDTLRATAESGPLPPGLDADLPRTVRPRRRG